MNKTALSGILLAAGIFVFTALFAIGSIKFLLDPEAIALVIGGSIAAILVISPMPEIKGAIKALKRWMFKNNVTSKVKILEQIIELAKAKRQSETAFNSTLNSTNDLFLKDAASILFWADAEVSEDEFRDLLQTRSNTFIETNVNYAKVFKTVTKFPPAFGMIGTVMGLIALMKTLGAEGAQDNLGKAMAVALVATLYGIGFNNLFLIPISDSMDKFAKAEVYNHNMVIEGLMLIQQRKPTKYIEEKLMSFIMPEERITHTKK